MVLALPGILEAEEKQIQKPEFLVAGHWLSAWEEDGAMYLFLPGWAEPEQVVTGQQLRLDGQLLQAGDSLAGIAFDKEYSAAVFNRQATLTVISTGELPTLFLDTVSGSMENLRWDKARQEQGFLQLMDSSGALVLKSSLDWISGRGNMTWELEKRGWGFKLPKAADLLGMAPSDKWVLLANAYDATRGLRNYAAYKMALETGMEYSRDLRFIDLYLNGEYVGLYQLTERITEGENALDIGDLDTANARENPGVLLRPEKLDIQQEWNEDGIIQKSWADLRSPADVSGGYILERNYGYKLEDKPFQFATDAKESFVVRYPSIVTQQEIDYISTLMQQVENAIYAPDHIDPASGKKLTELIDLDSWVRKMLVDETTKNEGMGTTSSYYYKKQGVDRVFAGPVWDYDKSFGSMGVFLSPEGLTYGSLHLDYSLWLKQFYTNPEVQRLARQYYQELYRPYLLSLAKERFREVSLEIQDSFEADLIRWRTEYETYDSSYDETNDTFGSLEAGVRFLERWTQARIAFLDRVWIDNEVLYYIAVVPEYEILYVLPEGTDLTEIGNVLGDEFVDIVTGEVPDYSKPLDRDYRLMVRSATDTSDMDTPKAQPQRMTLRLLVRWMIPVAALVGVMLILAWVDRHSICKKEKRDGT